VRGMYLSKLLRITCWCALTAAALHAQPAASKAAPRSSTPAVLRSLSLHDRIAQLLVVRGYGDYPPSENAELRRFTRWIQEDHVGGFIVAGRIRNGNVIGAQPFEMAAFINHMQRLAKTPLLVASDFERGASMRVAGTARFPYLMAFGAAHDLAATRELGAATAREARALGVTWVFAPDADVNNNPDNPIINVRSFGEDPQSVASGVSAFIDGAHSDPANYVLVTAKHFPGHGDTAEDTHLQLAKLDQPKERVEAVELVPFRAAVEHGVDSIMTAHMSVPAFEPRPLPATVSRSVLTGLLRDELGFKGLIVTDAMEMQAVASLFSPGEAAVRAVEAGADVLLMPTDPEACIRAIMSAVTSGRISRQRIDTSAAKVLAAKQRAGLFRSHFVNLDAISDEIQDPKLDRLAQRVAERAITLVKDDKHLFPVPASDGVCLVIVGEGQFSQHGEALTVELGRTIRDLKTYTANASTADSVLTAIANDTAAHCKQIYVAAFVTVAAFRGSVALQGGLNPFVKTMASGPVPVALISLGNPYLLRDFPDAGSYAATFSTSVTSEIAAAKAILGEIPITGRMPVSIPGLAKVGDGIDVPAKGKTASNGGNDTNYLAWTRDF
jgi:beta-N-acetylhexosaminidase